VVTRRLFRAGALTVAISVASSIAGLALAQPELEDAKRLFAEGEQAETAGDCRTAVEKWRAVLAIKETPQIHLRIGRCEESLGHLASAVAAYEKASDLAADNTAILDVAKQQLEGLDTRVPALTITWDHSIPDAAIDVDGSRVENGRALRIDPGKHHVHGAAPGREAFDRDVDLVEGGKTSIKVQLDPPAPIAPPEEPSSSLSPWPFVIMGGGVVALGVAIPLAIVGKSDLDEIYTHCDGPNADGHRVCPPAYEDGVSGVRVKYGVAGALGVVSAAALGVGATLLVMDLTAAPDAKTQSWTIAPWASPLGAGAAASGRF